MITCVQRRESNWSSVWLLLSALAVPAGCFLTPLLVRMDATPTGVSSAIAWTAVYWIAAFASFIASTIVFLRHSYLRGERETRRRQGLCPTCGYDLTANTSGVCPECGRVVTS
jgi:hypothetical protein